MGVRFPPGAQINTSQWGVFLYLTKTQKHVSVYTVFLNLKNSTFTERQNMNLFDPTTMVKLLNAQGRPIVFSVLIMDKSDSMDIHGNAPKDAINQHIRTLKADEENFHVTGVVGFASEYSVDIPMNVASEVSELVQYNTNGCTCLYETVELVLSALLEKVSPIEIPYRVVLAVFSDGEDNKSQRPLYPEKLQVISKKVIQLGWELRCVGFGIDAHFIAQQMGFQTWNAKSMANSTCNIEYSVRDITSGLRLSPDILKIINDSRRFQGATEK